MARRCMKEIFPHTRERDGHERRKCQKKTIEENYVRMHTRAQERERERAKEREKNERRKEVVREDGNV